MPARHALLLGAALASAGCEPSQAPPPPATAVAASADPPRQDLPEEIRALDLFGAWTVEAVLAPTNIRREQGWPQILLAGSRQLVVLSQCITVGPFEYGQYPNGIGIRIPEQSPTDRGRAAAPGPAPVQCARMPSPDEQLIPRILLTAERASRRPDGAVLLSGKAGTLVLRRPTGALANPRGEAPIPPRPPLIGAWRFVTVNGRTLPPAERTELLLRPNVLEWRSGCVNEARALSIDRDRLLPGAVDPFPVCERGRSESEEAIARLTSAPIATEMQRSGRLTLTGSGVTAVLLPLT